MKTTGIAILTGICTALILVLGVATFYFWQSNQKLSEEVTALRAERAAFNTEMEKSIVVSKHNACVNNLRQIDGAKQQWALENNKATTAQPTMQDIANYLGAAIPQCPDEGRYTVGYVGGLPSCSIADHQLHQ